MYYILLWIKSDFCKNLDRETRSAIRHLHRYCIMKEPQFSSTMFSMAIVIIVIVFWFQSPAFGQNKSMTERECALKEGAEIIWDLRSYHWICCIAKGEYLEACVPISDKGPLPKTSTKPSSAPMHWPS